MNMRDGILICKAEASKEWNYSAPHGAGRIFSRSKAKQLLCTTQFENDMMGIYSTCVNSNTLDESPRAYKSMQDIMTNLGSHITVLEHIKPLYNFKG